MTKDHHAEFMTLLTGLPGKGKNRIQQEVWRYVNVVDVEHGGCKIGIYVPKLPGRGGSISANRRLIVTQCAMLDFKKVFLRWRTNELRR